MLKNFAFSRAVPAVAFAALAVAAMNSVPAHAQLFDNRPQRAYCFNSAGDYGVGKICDFDTYAQCLATQQGVNGSCERNPWYAYNEDAPRYSSQPRRPNY